MQICRVLAGYSYGRADLVRRAMAKKKPEVMEKEKDIFLEGTRKNGIDEKTAEAIFEQMNEFAKYAFNKSHAAAYAVVAYRTAYLKCHYPREYMCALLNTVMGHEDKVGSYISDCADMGISILPPDVNHSYGNFSVEGGNLRFGLAAIKNVGSLFADRIIEERQRKPFGSIEDFLSRCSRYGNIKGFESMIKAGALDCFGLPRSRMMAGIGAALETVTRDRNRNSEGQISLFGGSIESESAFEFPQSNIPEFLRSQLLSGEKEMTGLYFSGHPLDGYGDLVAQIGALDTKEIYKKLSEGTTDKRDAITFVGLVTKKQSKVTKKNDMMAFVTAEDEHGEAEILVFPKQYAEMGPMIKENEILVFTGNAELKESFGDEENDRLVILLKSVCTPEEAKSSAPVEKPHQQQVGEKSLYIKVTEGNKSLLDSALDLASKSGGHSRILVYFESEKRLCAAKGKTALISERLLKQLYAIMGNENIAVK